MNNSTLHRFESGYLSIVQSTVSIKKNYRGFITSKSCRLLAIAVLLLCGISNKASALGTTYYYPSSVSGGSDATYCIGSPASSMSGIISTGSASATLGTSATVSWSWYYNTTGATGTLTGATLVYTGASYTAGAAPFTATLPGASISTATAGTYYYFLYVTSSGGTTSPPPLYSPNATINITGPPGPISGGLTACPGTTTSLADGTAGGTWSSSIPGTATVDAAGLVTGVAAGTTSIIYTGCGAPASVVVTINPDPAPITGTNVFCQATTVTLNDPTAPGTGTWSSSAPPVADVTLYSGAVTGFSGGTATISYTYLGCSSTYVVTVNPKPDAILGALRECQSSAITLTDVITGGTWTSGNISVATIDPASGLVIGLIPGTAVITYTNACGDTTAVDTVKAIPDTLVGTNFACVGANTTFADLPLGGVWTSGNTSVATVLTGSGVITGVGGGTADITYTIPPGCFNHKVVHINALPPAIGGTKQVCPGATTTLTNALHGTWSSVESFVASIGTSGVVTGIVPDTTTIVFTDSVGCSINTVVTVNPAPLQITGGITTCATSIDTVYDASLGGTWSSSTPSVATINPSGIITTVTGGTTTISYKLADGCGVAKVVTVNSLPSALITYDFATNSFFTATYYVSYQWYDSLQGLIPGANSFQTAALYNGNYWVVVTDTNGCSAMGAPLHYNTNMVGVQNQAATLLRIYPNPVTNILYIESDVRVHAVITSIDGKTELEQADAKEINTGGLANGMYFIALYDDSGVRLMVQKLIKQ